MLSEACILCGEKQTQCFANIGGCAYFVCPCCDLRFMSQASRLCKSDEDSRYRLHNNVVEDPNYQAFVKPLVDQVVKLVPAPAQGLDFGCGAGPVASYLLEQQGYRMHLYDPLFYPDLSVFDRCYELIIACEVLEHLHRPCDELRKLKALLKPGAGLFIMTLLVMPDTSFETWHYRRDPSHVAFYSEQTLRWIKTQFGFSELNILNHRLAVLR